MEAPETLLETLCALRRITYAGIDPDWVIQRIGGAHALWPGLMVGRDVRQALPELRSRSAEVTARLADDERFVLRWIERPPRDGRTRYYEVIIHRCTDSVGSIIWLIDRTAYGRLKMRIDRYYSELVESTLLTEATDPQLEAPDPDRTR